MNARLPFLREKAGKLTTAPGVYLMKNAKNEIIYIGKAKNLHNRVGSYFREHADHTPKVASMVEHVYDFHFIVTDSEYEALVLECSLIKQHQPKYNILLKDDKGYHYICISNEPYPRVTAEKNKEKDGIYFGPYMSAFITKETVKEINTIFQLPTCHKTFPVVSKHVRPCLNYHIKQCMGLCRGNISVQQYQEIIEQVKDYIESGGTASVKRMRIEMQKASDALQFERASILRNRIRAIQKAGETQKILDADIQEADVIAMAEYNGMQCVSILLYRNHRLFDKETFFFSETDLTDFMDSFLSQYYHSHTDFPDYILVGTPLQDQLLLEQMLHQHPRSKKVKILVPQRGKLYQLVQLSKNNASEELALKFGRVGKDIKALEELGTLLDLPNPPVYIESYDISNLSSSSMVAGMVVFENGLPLKKAYKRFSIKAVQTQDDYHCMQEVLSRRFQHLKDQDEEWFSRKPDLILLDGGIGHVHAVQSVMDQFGFKIPLYGMVKDNKHRTRAIASNGGEIAVTSYHEAFMLLTRIQDEVHRYSVQYMKNRHKKNSYSLTLTSVKGIGAKKAEQLLLHYKTKEQLKDATIEDLMKVAGVRREVAMELQHLIDAF